MTEFPGGVVVKDPTLPLSCDHCLWWVFSYWPGDFCIPPHSPKTKNKNKTQLWYYFLFVQRISLHFCIVTRVSEFLLRVICNSKLSFILEFFFGPLCFPKVFILFFFSLFYLIIKLSYFIWLYTKITQYIILTSPKLDICTAFT